MAQHLSNKVWLDVVKELLADAGLNADAELANLKCEGIDVCESNGQVNTVLAGKIWSVAAKLLNNPVIGLYAAEKYFQPAMWGSLGLGVLCSSSIRDALERMVRHYRVFSDVGPFSIVERDDLTGLLMRPALDAVDVGYETVDFAIGCFVRLLNSASVEKINPVLIQLAHPKPDNPLYYEAFFGCDVEFGGEGAAIFYPTAVVDLPLSMSNRTVALCQDRLTEDYIERLKDQGVVSLVRREINKSLLAGYELSGQKAADALNLSQRSLQRKLSCEGTTFKSLLSEVRKELAADYLRRPYATLNETAYLLGFSDHSSFTRAFKRWHGRTPAEYRNELDKMK